MAITTGPELVIAVTDALYGEAVAGKTVSERIRYHFKQSTRSVAYGLLRQERVGKLAEETARRDAEATLEMERRARIAAEVLADAAADTLLGGV